MSRSLISFLGTSDYLDCRYDLDGDTGPVVKYIQEDMALRFCKDWNEKDAIRIFTTDRAKQVNWIDNGHKDSDSHRDKTTTGLEKRLGALDIKPEIHQIAIPVGNSEDEIWKIFEIVYDTITDEEEIIFDITHSFRSIPMLFMVLAGYAGIMKQADILGIYYGAFEVLGPPKEVEKRIKDPNDRIAPIFDLTSFMELTRWSRATQSFIFHGISSEFQDLVKKRTGLVLRKTKGRDKTAQNMNYLEQDIGKISKNIQFNRGYRIITHDYDKTLGNIRKIKADPAFIPPFTPLIEKIENKIEKFEKYDVRNGFRAVDWCMSHGLIQQAVTMLWENIMTWVLDSEGLDWWLKDNREAASSALHFLSKKKKEPKARALSDLVSRLRKNQALIDISHLLEKLRVIRNDINHGGFNHQEDFRAKSAQSIEQEFHRIYEKIRQRLWQS